MVYSWMPAMATAVITRRIVECADEAGACVAGVARVARLREEARRRHGASLEWLHDDRSLLVICLEHPAEKPHLDWWGGPGGTPGNRCLIEVAARVCRELGTQLQVAARDLPYHLGRGGVFLKDAAVMAGLGTMGANNLFVTPSLGPRVRLRAIALDVDAASPAAEPWEPCRDCDKPCWGACPQDAFATGSYDARRCSVQMRQDESRPRRSAAAGVEEPSYRVAYCRACELACPVGRSSASEIS